jgi:6-phosphogluconolactonase
VLAYEKTLSKYCGHSPILDIAHLGLGSDGHTASLIPHDPVLDVMDSNVALTGLYQGRRRMTLTYPMLNRARHILWIATGAEKAPMIARLTAADPSIPAGLIEQSHAHLLADEAAVAG